MASRNKNTKPTDTLGSIFTLNGIEKPLLLLTGALIVTGGVYYANRKIQYKRTRKAEENTAEKGTVENIAKRLKIAMGGLIDGTDEAAIYSALAEINSQEEYQGVIQAYAKLTGGKSLNKDLEYELGSDFNKVSAIISQKKRDRKGEDVDNSKVFARKLHEAINYHQFGMPDTDIDTLFDIFLTIPNNQVFQNTKAEYQAIAGTDLWTDLKAEWRLSRSIWYADMFSTYNDWSGKRGIDKLREIAKDRFGTL